MSYLIRKSNQILPRLLGLKSWQTRMVYRLSDMREWKHAYVSVFLWRAWRMAICHIATGKGTHLEVKLDFTSCLEAHLYYALRNVFFMFTLAEMSSSDLITYLNCMVKALTGIPKCCSIKLVIGVGSYQDSYLKALACHILLFPSTSAGWHLSWVLS